VQLALVHDLGRPLRVDEALPGSGPLKGHRYTPAAPSGREAR
jgi:hypothetical protein